LVARRSAFTATVTGNLVHYVGGCDYNSTMCRPLAAVEHAWINQSSAFFKPSASGTQLSVIRGEHATAVLGNSVYLLGGATGTIPVASVDRAIAAPDDTLGAFSAPAGVTLDVGRANAPAAVVGNWLY